MAVADTNYCVMVYRYSDMEENEDGEDWVSATLTPTLTLTLTFTLTFTLILIGKPPYKHTHTHTHTHTGLFGQAQGPHGADYGAGVCDVH